LKGHPLEIHGSVSKLFREKVRKLLGFSRDERLKEKGSAFKDPLCAFKKIELIVVKPMSKRGLRGVSREGISQEKHSWSGNCFIVELVMQNPYDCKPNA